MSRVSQPYAPGGTPVWTSYTYDASGRTLTVTAPDGSVTSYAYQFNQTTVTDPAGNWKTFTTDSFGNLTVVTEPNPGGGANLTTNYAYTPLNQLTQVSMTRGGSTQTRTFLWSGLNMTSATNPENGTVTYTYDAANRVTSRTDAKGQYTSYTWDPYGSMVSQYHYAPALDQNGNPYLQLQTDQSVSCYYDQYERLSQMDFGISAGAGGGSFQYNYTYNTAGRVLSQQVSIYPGAWYGQNPSFTASYGWDAQGRMTGATYPAVGGSSLGTYQYQYDNMGRLGSLAQYNWNAGQWNTIANAGYSVANQMTSLWTSFTGTETRTYNSLLQLTRATVPGIMDMQYNYTAGQNNGRITSSQDYISGETVQYAYDGLLRLANAQTTGTQWGEAYSYDGFGNLTGKTPTKGSAPALSVSYNPATNQPYNGNYDANGNAPVGTWNVENKLVGQVLDGTQVNWSYDPFGQRVARYTSSGSWWSEWDGHWDFYLYGPTGQRMAQIGCDTISGQQIGGSSWCVSEGTDVYFGGKLIAETDASGQVLAPTDRLGTVRGVNTNGTMAQPTYYPYGEPKTAGGIDRQQQFGTYVRDSTPSAQDYAMQRYYSNVVGRFYSPDPGGIATANPKNPGSWNRYAYVHGDPVNFTDPTGMCDEDYTDSLHVGGRLEDCYEGDGGGGGGDVTGGDPCSSDDGLGFAPNPFCYAPGPIPPLAPAKPKTPPCDPGFLSVGFGNFTASDINYAARTVFAESSGNWNEDVDIADVIVNRLDNPGFDNGGLVTLTMVVNEQNPSQFNAVTPPPGSSKFQSSGPGEYETLNPANCASLASAIEAMAQVALNGATTTFNSFNAASTGHSGTVVGGSVFWTQLPQHTGPPVSRAPGRGRRALEALMGVD
jgi:RHS repeat-associated protein